MGNVGLAVSLVVIVATLAPSLLALAAYAASLRAGRRHGTPSGGPVEFVVVSKAGNETIQSLLEVISETRRRYPGRRIWLVVDDDSEGLPVLSELSGDLGYSLVVVPSTYRRGRHKSRAIQYFIDYYVKEDRWYVFLDDDSYPLDSNLEDHLTVEIPAYNGVIYPRRGRSIVAWLADSTRYFHSVTRNRTAMARLGVPLYGFHGELLVVHGSVLKRIPFATDSIVEDTMYAARLARAGVPVGMLPVRVSILSPHSVHDLWRQRTRWNLGVLRDIVRGRYPPLIALYRGADAIAWLAAPFAPLAWAYAIMTVGGHLHLSLLGLLMLSVAFAAHMLLPVSVEGVRGLRYLPLVPAAMAGNALSSVYALIAWPLMSRRFVIIDKRIVVEESRRVPPAENPMLEPKVPATGAPTGRPYRGMVN